MQGMQIQALPIKAIGSKAVNASGICTSKHQQGDALKAMHLLTELQNGHDCSLLLIGIVSFYSLLKIEYRQQLYVVAFSGENQPCMSQQFSVI